MQDQVNRLGINESRPMFAIIGTAVSSVVNIDSNEDGRVTTLEVLNAVQTVAIKVIRDVPNIAEFRAEAADYTENEKEELIDELAADLEMDRVKTRTLFLRAAKLVLDVIDFVIDAGKPEEEFEADFTVVRS